jgi:glycosyltransferase involved in cell wall biosynthesis
MGAPSARVAEVGKHWAEEGHHVTILTGFPNHPTGKLFPEYKDKIKKKVHVESFNGCKIVRTWLLTIPNGKPIERILNYTSFFFSALITGLRLRDFDVIIATSPQLLVGLSGYLISLIKRKPFIFEVRDLWPESLIGSGIGSEDSLFIKVIDKLADFLYAKSDHIVVVTEKFKKELIERKKVKANKISINENGIETDHFCPIDGVENLKKQLKLDGKFVVSYIGTHGYAHGLETILETADILKDKDNIHFLMVGEGARKDYLVNLSREKKLKNITFLDFQARDMIPKYINISDACTVLLRDSNIFRTVIPTKMLEFMACGRPVILGVDGQAREVMENGKGGVYIPPADSEKLANVVTKLKDNEGLRKNLGESGRDFILSKYTRKEKAKEYINILSSLIS